MLSASACPCLEIVLLLITYQLVEKARFSLVESYGVEGVCEPQKLIIHVVTDLVKESPQKTSKSDNLPALCRSHPDGNTRGLVSLPGIVQPLELTPAPGGTCRKHLNLHSWNLETGRESRHELLTDLFSCWTVVALQCVR